MSATAGDSAKVTVFVAVSLADAFAVFTEEIDLWWRRGAKYRIPGKRRGQLFFEAKPDGRLFETFALSTGPRTIEVGKVLVFEPPSCLELEWRGVNFEPHERTFVEITFTPSGDGTLVTVRHYGWSALPEGHPARHDLVGADFSRMIGMWWGSLMSGLRAHVDARWRSPPRAP